MGGLEFQLCLYHTYRHVQSVSQPDALPLCDRKERVQGVCVDVKQGVGTSKTKQTVPQMKMEK